MKPKWCRHIKWIEHHLLGWGWRLPKSNRYTYGATVELNWKFCPICGTKRPPTQKK